MSKYQSVQKSADDFRRKHGETEQEINVVSLFSRAVLNKKNQVVFDGNGSLGGGGGNIIVVDPINGDYTTISAAMSAAVTGDTVKVNPGDAPYNEQIQTKDGVVLYFEAGAVVNYTGSGSAFLEPVAGGTVQILGFGQFYKTGSQAAQHVFSLSKTVDMRVVCEIVECNPDSVQANSLNVSTIKIAGAYDPDADDGTALVPKLSLNCHYVEGDGCTALRLAGGWAYITANEIKSSGAGVSTVRMPGVGIDDNDVGDAFSIAWFEAKKLRSDPAERVVFADGDQSHEGIIYINVPQISGCYEASPANGLFESYIKAQLIIPSYESGAIGSSGGRALIKFAGAATNVVNITCDNCTTQGTDPALQLINVLAGSKFDLGGIYTEGGLPLEINGGATSGEYWIRQIQASTSGTLVVKLTSGYGAIRGARIVTPAGANFGVSVISGTLELHDCRVDSTAAATGNPISKSGGTLILDNCILVSAGARNSITAGNAQNVKIYGTCFANVAEHANITLQVGTLTADTLVV